MSDTRHNVTTKLPVIENATPPFVGVKLNQQVSNPLGATKGIYNKNGELYYFDGSTEVQITSSGIVAGTGGGTLSSPSNLTGFVDNDNDSGVNTFTIYHDVTIPTVGKELIQIRENGEVEIYGGPFIGGTPTAHFTFKSKENNGASAIGFEFNTNNALSTDGSKVASWKNNSVEQFSLRKGTSLYGDTGVILAEEYASDGSMSVQRFVDKPNQTAGMLIDQGLSFEFGTVDDWTFSPGYKQAYVYLASDGGWPNPFAQISVQDNGAALSPSFYVNALAANMWEFTESGASKLAIDNTGKLKGADTDPFKFQSREANGASAVGYELDTLVALTTNGAKLFSLKNFGTEHLNVKRGTDLFAIADANLVEFNQPNGTRRLQLSIEDATYQALMPETDRFDIYAASDFAYPAGYNDAGIYIQTKGVDITGNGIPYIQEVVTGNSLATFASTLVSGAAGAGCKWCALVSSSTVTAEQCMHFSNVTKFGGLKTNIRWYVGVSGHSGSGGRDQHVGLDADGLFVGASGATHLGTPSKWGFQSLAVDSASAIAYELDTFNQLTTAGAKHSSWKRFGFELMYLDKDGNLNITGTVTASGLSGGATGTLTGEYTATAVSYMSAGENFIGVTDTTAARTITLANADKVAGRFIEIKDESLACGTNANPITVIPQTGLIDGVASLTITVDGGVMRVYSNGTNWFTR